MIVPTPVSETAVTRKRDPFIQALDSIRRRSEACVYAPGAPVVIIEEARRLRLSTTPVREALAWLCGEGLIERAPSGGFLAPRMDAAVVRDRFAFRLLCLATSLEMTAVVHDRSEPLPSSDAPDHRLAGQLDRMVRGSGNSVLAEAFGRVGRQLLPLAEAERRLFHDRDAEATAILHLYDAGSAPALRLALAAYHQRRMDAAPLLVLDLAAERGGDPGEGG